jgi:CRISPR-associated DxTHG motif protein
MMPLNDRRPGFRYHLITHSFRFVTVIAAWLLLALAFYESPEVLTGAQRLIQRGIEFVGDNIPPPWGPRIEFVFREIGGLIWLQITLLVLALRVVLSTIAMIFRAARRRRGERI